MAEQVFIYLSPDHYMTWAYEITSRSLFHIEPEPLLKDFIATMSAKYFRTIALVRDNVLCHFGFSRKGVLVERSIGKTGMSHSLIPSSPFFGLTFYFV